MRHTVLRTHGLAATGSKSSTADLRRDGNIGLCLHYNESLRPRSVGITTETGERYAEVGTFIAFGDLSCQFSPAIARPGRKLHILEIIAAPSRSTARRDRPLPVRYQIAVRRLAAAGLPFYRRALQVKNFLARRPAQRLGNLCGIIRRACRAGVALVRDDQNRTATRSGSLSNSVSPAPLRPVTDDRTTMPATLAPRRAAAPTAAIAP